MRGRMLAEKFGIGPDDCVHSAIPLVHSNAVMVAWPIALHSGCSIALRRRFSAGNWLDDARPRARFDGADVLRNADESVGEMVADGSDARGRGEPGGGTARTRTAAPPPTWPRSACTPCRRRRCAARSPLADGFGDFLAAQPDLGPEQWPSLLRMTAALPRKASFKFRARDLSSRGAESAGDRVWVRADGAGPSPPGSGRR
ncbi:MULTISPECIES: hypothetical protein [Dietzia]|uniref:AMP-dependent synthetase/ligase domain-containing protein n=2 Tax=Dietzia maris TaxID=37915 RepID=A0ABT8H427_9ACTN|nr:MULTISPECIES: hypothetical protein [Dietzia]MCZ4541447.1 hypothetical protein [Dietzia maris]MCZ4657292.1 hypothetical protein [Dietzia kunjamensis]MDN4507218.1 hypothetical protein [Dietzia maris]MDV3356383.1 hypothetical protein [Dietzia sp. IN118]